MSVRYLQTANGFATRIATSCREKENMRQTGSILLYGLLILAILAAVSGIVYKIKDWGVMEERARWETVIKEAKEKETERANKISAELENTKVVRDKQARTVARLQRELSNAKRVVVVDSGQCWLTFDSVLLHNAAASGENPATSKPDGSSTGIAVDTLADTCQANYSTYHQVADRLRALQEFVK